jgi:glycosyltransferase involved in cell wall biosynthesis
MSLKVLHLSSYDVWGGAGRAAFWQHRGLLGQGVSSRMIVRQKCGMGEHVEAISPPTDGFSRITRVLKRNGMGMEKRLAVKSLHRGDFVLEASDLSATLLSNTFPEVDLINIHFCSGFLAISELLEVIPQEIPVVITLHEMSFFTGGCHYASGCRHFEGECGDCPMLSRPSNTCIVTDSEWLAQEARQSGLLKGFDIRTIHYGIDPEVFRPLDKTFSKQTLGIDSNRPVVLFASENLQDRRKGFDLLRSAIRDLNCGDAEFISFGRIGDYSGITDRIRHFGYIENDRLMALLYNAADLFVMPSREEAFGLTCLESMACGTPVLGFQTGGIPEMIEHGKTGYLSGEISEVGLKRGLTDFFENQSRYFEHGKSAREKALNSFGKEKNAGLYRDLYQRLLKGS